MTIVVEPTENYSMLPLATQEFVTKMIFGKSFNSLDDIFNQKDEKGHRMGSFFRRYEVKIIPKNLPEQITEINLITNGDFYTEFIALKAKYTEKNG